MGGERMNKKMFVIVALLIFASLTLVNAYVILQMKSFNGKINIVPDTNYFNIVYEGCGNPLEGFTHDFGSMKVGDSVTLEFQLIGKQDCRVSWTHNLDLDNFAVEMQLYVNNGWVIWESDTIFCQVRKAGFSTHIRDCRLNIVLTDTNGLSDIVTFTVSFDAIVY